jgi:hypothetical protein
MPPVEHSSNPSEYLTAMWCDTRRLTTLHFPSQHQRLNNTATSAPTAIKYRLKPEASKWISQQLWPTMTIGWIGLTSKYRALLGIICTRGTSRDFCDWLLIALFVFDKCVQLSGVFLKCVLLRCACAYFGLSALKTPWCVKPEIGKPL